MNDEKNLFIERFKQLLDENHMTVYRLALEIDMHKGTLSKYYNGCYSPKIGTVKKIAEYFEVSPLWLSGYSDERNATETPEQSGEDKTKVLVELINQLTPQQKDMIITMIRSLVGE